MFVGYLANMGLTLALIDGNDRIGYDVDLDIIFLNGSDPNPFTSFLPLHNALHFIPSFRGKYKCVGPIGQAG